MNPHRAQPMQPRPFRVKRVHSETHDTYTLELEPEAGSKDLAFGPGQFNMVYVFGVGEVPLSLSGDPAGGPTFVHTVRAVGGVTKALRRLKPGAVVGVRGPFGTGWPLREAAGNDLVIVAGGIGLAPLRPVMYHVHSHREMYGKVVLLYGTRTPEDMPYRPELEKWRAQLDMEVQVTVDWARGPWRGNVGVVTTLIARSVFDPQNTLAMVCGPGVMMRFAALELQRRGVPADNVFLSLERNMKCGVGLCGHCQFGPAFVCKDGPVFRYDRIKDTLGRREI